MRETAPSEAKSKPKIFYGWKVLGVGFAGAFFASSIGQLFTGAMLPNIEADTGWSRTSITLAVTFGSILAGVLSPLVGRLADKHGARPLSTAGLLVVVPALIMLALSSYVHVALFYVAYIVGRGVSQNTLAGVVPRTTAVNWFRRKRGRALGMSNMALPLGGAVLVPIAQVISDGFGWQTAYYVVGAAMLVILLPAFLLVLRRRPEDMGLLPDGDDSPSIPTAGPAAAGPKPAQAEDEEYSWSLQQAWKTRSFWLLIVAVSAGTFGNGGIGFHQAAYFQDQGIAAATAALAISAYSLSGAFATLLWGFLVEHVSERLLGAFSISIASLLCLFLLTVDTTAEAMIFAVLFGLAARGESSIILMIQAQYFGRGSFGAITGFTAPFQQVSLGLGPIVAAVIYEVAGDSYTPAFILFSVMFATAALLVWLSRKPLLPLEATQAAI